MRDATIDDLAAMHGAAEALLALGCRAVLLKGGHLAGDTVLRRAGDRGRAARLGEPADRQPPYPRHRLHPGLGDRRRPRARARRSRPRSSARATMCSARSPGAPASAAATARSTTPTRCARLTRRRCASRSTRSTPSPSGRSPATRRRCARSKPGCPMRSMQAIAAENNLSETAFFVPEGEGYRLRWFTPDDRGRSVRPRDAGCGICRLPRGWRRGAAASSSRPRRPGALTVARDGELLALDFPSRPPAPCAMPEALAAALGQRPAALLAARDYLAVYDGADEIAALAPDFAALAALDRFAVIVTAPGDGRGRFRVALFRAGARGRRGPGDRLGALHADPLLGGAARQDPARRRASCRGAAAACPARLQATG